MSAATVFLCADCGTDRLPQVTMYGDPGTFRCIRCHLTRVREADARYDAGEGWRPVRNVARPTLPNTSGSAESRPGS